MSTKIYTAWKLPQSRLDEAAEIFTQRTLDVAYPRFRQIALRLLAKYRAGKDCDDPLDTFEASRNASFYFRHIAAKHEDNPFALCSGANAYLDGRNVYLIPYGCTVAINPKHFPEWIEDYHYQNQVDEDIESLKISKRQWEARGKKWDEILFNRSYRFQLPIIDFSLFDPGMQALCHRFELEQYPMRELENA